MKRLILFVTLVMIALLLYSRSWYQSSSSTGGGDSVTVAIEDLRIANVKMTQLKYAKQELELKDSIIKINETNINILKSSINNVNNDNYKLKKQRNILGITVIGLLGAIIGISL